MTTIDKLMEKGVRIASPATVEIGSEIDPQRISGDGVVIYPGCRIYGKDTLILQGARLGFEAPVTVENCRIGPDVELKGGFFQKAVFLKGAKLGLGSHVREATILEEQASTAHTVGLKHTIMLPFVTLGSLINFCDCLMAGGTSRKNHSEVGSAYIHFNFTPSQDKATASLIGDVPRGVMLNQKPIFLGGQGGMVGPCRLGFGITVAAGTIVRKDETRDNRLIFGGGMKAGNLAFTPGLFRADKRIVVNNLIYIGNLVALRQWYHQVRPLFVGADFPETLLQGLKENIERAIEERIVRLEAVCTRKSPAESDPEPSAKLQLRRDLYRCWPELRGVLESSQTDFGKPALMEPFLEKIRAGISRRGKDYLAVIQGLEPADSKLGTRWLQGIVNNVIAQSRRIMPALA